jgi:HNH endonuclease
MLDAVYATQSMRNRFLAKIDYSGPNGCWLWTASLGRGGYGQFGIRHGYLIHAHRVALLLFRGRPIIPGRTMNVDHLCRNRRCVNPDHLEYVTQRENMRRSAPAVKSHCTHGHLYDAENTYIINEHRHCRACHAMRQRRRRAAGDPAMVARAAVRNALRRGQIAKQPCTHCGSNNVEAHHTDYSQPLIVTWLCAIHHREVHRLEKAVEVMS